MKNTILLVCLLALCSSPACEDDTVTPPPPQTTYGNLTQRSHVLNNLEVSYNRRHLNKYEELLDQDFVFYFYSGDVGGNVPAQWSRLEEMEASRHLFDPNYVDSDPSDGIREACTKIDMDVKWEDGLQWQEVPQGDGEKWYTATVFYNFDFQMGAYDHLINNPGSKAEFTVRNAGTDDDPHWQLVAMRDLDQDLRARTSTTTQQTTWGSVKAIYR
jgi:hypothetical protein